MQENRVKQDKKKQIKLEHENKILSIQTRIS